MAKVISFLHALVFVLATKSCLEDQKDALRGVLLSDLVHEINDIVNSEELTCYALSRLGLYDAETDRLLTEVLTLLFSTMLRVGCANMVAKPNFTAEQNLRILNLLKSLTLDVDYTMKVDSENSNTVIVTFATAQTISMPSDDNIGDATITTGVQQLYISGLSYTEQSVTSLKFNFSPAQNPSNTSSLISIIPSDEDISKSIFLVLMRLFSLLFNSEILTHGNLISVRRGEHGFQLCEDEYRESRVNVGGISLNVEKFEEHWPKVIEFLSTHEALIQGTIMKSANYKDPNGLESEVVGGRIMSRA